MMKISEDRKNYQVTNKFEKKSFAPKQEKIKIIPNEGCTMCPELVASRKRITYGYGNKNSFIIFLGEAPGYKGADLTGIPFTKDKSGELFNEMLLHAGWKMEDVYTTNIVKCCPPGNRTPKEDEVNNCAGKWLEGELKQIKPRANYEGPIILVTCGSTATRYFINQGVTKARMAQHKITWNKIKFIVIPIFHPAYILRTGAVQEYIQDFEELRKIHDEFKKEAMTKGVLKFMEKN